MLPPLPHLLHRIHSALVNVSPPPLLAMTDFLSEKDMVDWESSIQQLLTSHATLYTMRQAMYGIVLNVSDLYKETLNVMKTATVTDAVYFGIVTVTILMFLQDIKYEKKSAKRAMQLGRLNMDKRTQRVLEMVFLVMTMVLFQNVEVATG